MNLIVDVNIFQILVSFNTIQPIETYDVNNLIGAVSMLDDDFTSFFVSGKITKVIQIENEECLIYFTKNHGLQLSSRASTYLQ